MDETVSCGIDIEEISRFKKFISFPSKTEPFIASVFTPEETEKCLAFGSLFPFAAGFSCKEAVFKAFGISWTNSSIKWHDVELIFPEQGNINNHFVRLSGFAQQIFKERGYSSINVYIEDFNNLVIVKVLLLKKLSKL